MNSMVIKSITILKEQDEFLQGEGKNFNFSKFVRDKFGEYMKTLKEYRTYMEVKEDDKN